MQYLLTQEEYDANKRIGPTSYHLGKRDALCELFMLLRNSGEREVLRELAGQLMRLEEPNPHAVHYWKTHPPTDVKPS